MIIDEDFCMLGVWLSNWGCWGVGDERGTFNYIMFEWLVVVVALVRIGKMFLFGILVGSDGF